MRLVFWRHGQTDQNLYGRIQGARDFPLNATGNNQAKLVAPQITKLRPTAIYTSPQKRAVETARYVADLTGIDPIAEPRLRERSYGQWEGLTSPEIHEQWPDQWERWMAGREPEGVGVESRTTCGKRVAKAVNEIASSADDDATILFVAHGGSISSGIMMLLDQNPSEWNALRGLDNCHWGIVAPRAGGGWRLLSYNRLLADITDLERLV